MRMYEVRTTNLGADGYSSLLFTTKKRAKAWLDMCDNGEIEAHEIEIRPVHSYEAMTWDDILYWVAADPPQKAARD